MNDRVALETRAGQRVPVTGGAGLPADGGGRPVAGAASDGAPAFSDLPSAEQFLPAQLHDVAHRRRAEQPAVFAAEL